MTPIDLKFENLGIGIGYDAKATWNFPRPGWAGPGMRDIIDDQISASLAQSSTARCSRLLALGDFLAIEPPRGHIAEDHFAVVVSADEGSRHRVPSSAEVMKWNAVEV